MIIKSNKYDNSIQTTNHNTIINSSELFEIVKSFLTASQLQILEIAKSVKVTAKQEILITVKIFAFHQPFNINNTVLKY